MDSSKGNRDAAVTVDITPPEGAPLGQPWPSGDVNQASLLGSKEDFKLSETLSENSNKTSSTYSLKSQSLGNKSQFTLNNSLSISSQVMTPGSSSSPSSLAPPQSMASLSVSSPAVSSVYTANKPKTGKGAPTNSACSATGKLRWGRGGNYYTKGISIKISEDSKSLK